MDEGSKYITGQVEEGGDEIRYAVSLCAPCCPLPPLALPPSPPLDRALLPERAAALLVAVIEAAQVKRVVRHTCSLL